MKTVVITFRNGTKLSFEPKSDTDFDLHRISKDFPIIFNNLWINTKDIMIIEVKEDEQTEPS